MVLAAIGRAASRVGAKIASRPAAAGAAGLAGGVALDDIPIVGPRVDPTESPGPTGLSLFRIAVVGVLLIVGLSVVDDL